MDIMLSGIIGVGIISAVMISFMYFLSDFHVVFKLICGSFAFLMTLMIPFYINEYALNNCDLMLANSTIVYNQTTNTTFTGYEYSNVCTQDNLKSPPQTLYITYAFIIMAACYWLLYLLYEVVVNIFKIKLN